MKSSVSNLSALLSALLCATAASTLSQPARAAEPIRIVSGQEKQNGDVLKTIFGEFNAQNPNDPVNLELDNKSDVDTTQKVLADIVAGSAPDAVRVTGAVLRAYVDSGRAQPLDSCLASKPELAAELDKGLLEGFKVGGKLSAMPWYTTLPALFINADAFRAAGLDPSKPPQTWSELEAAAAKLTNKDAHKYGVLMYMPNTYVYEAQVKSAGGQIVGADGKSAVAGPESVAVMAFERGLVEKGYMPAIAPGAFWGQFGAMFQSGDVAMLLVASSAYPQLTKNAKFDVELAPMPVRDGGTRITTASSNGFVMLATDPDRQKATCQALLSLVTPEAVALTVKATASSPHNTAATTNPALLGDYYKAHPSLLSINAQPSAPWYSVPGKANSEFQSNFGDIQYEILTGVSTPQEGLARLADSMNALLEAN
ncbi:ABC transporter substrate-binding protein [Kaistia sp. 32K]|uniref:extracellular solute-binding protein n=1 Tax=Kaistia sp. 32K TaxID=2795690 RepID=UPI00191677B2|nr:extracellular solute-binding protein [Kaistia sp. 32K]BCP56342.1 ABC transporter substrate-binding protein [Kaistia sp. 32K]